MFTDITMLFAVPTVSNSEATMVRIVAPVTMINTSITDITVLIAGGEHVVDDLRDLREGYGRLHHGDRADREPGRRCLLVMSVCTIIHTADTPVITVVNVAINPSIGPGRRGRRDAADHTLYTVVSIE